MSKASVKISKNHHHHHHQQQQLSSLKPKVYITHSSTFKTLVQELTGNNGSPESSIPPTIFPPPLDTGIHGLQIKHKNQHPHNNQHTTTTTTNNQDYIPVFEDSSWSTHFDHTNYSSNDLQIETNIDPWLHEIGPFA
ncbi:hypothetical protein Lser_V15G15425 [Lactuca serriola]